MSTSVRQRLVAIVVGAAAAAGAAFLLVRPSAPAGHAPPELEAPLAAIRLDTVAPNVSLWNRAGQSVPLASYRGRFVFVNFWATWCGPCREEMPSLIALARSLDPRDVAFVSIAEDDTWEPLDAYLRANPLPFDVFRDQPPRVEDPFETRSYPTSFLIDRDGRARYRFNGGRDWNDGAAARLLGALGVRTRTP